MEKIKALNIVHEYSCGCGETGYFRIEDRDIVEDYCSYYDEYHLNGYDECIYIEECEVYVNEIIEFNAKNIDEYEEFLEWRAKYA